MTAEVQTEDAEFVVGVWDDGRIGTFRGMRSGKHDYGARVFGSEGIVNSGRSGGYVPLVEKVVAFFKTGEVPVPADETIEIFAFMSAADESKTRNGAPVSVQTLIQKAKR